MTLLTAKQWDERIKAFPGAHLLQTSLWGNFKHGYGWEPCYLANQNAGAQILFRKLLSNLTIAYIPKGPLGEDWQILLEEASELCRKKHAIVLYVEPDYWQADKGDFETMLEGFSPAEISIQPRRTILVSLDGGEEDWMKRMKQKTRYNIRLARKKEVVVNRSNNIKMFNDLMKETGQRDAFGIHEPAYYKTVYDLFHPKGMCEMFMATYKDEPLAAIMAFKHGNRAWYFYGASNNMERNRMPTYLLQLEVIRWAAASGCEYYDLWGVPDEEQDKLEREFMKRSDGLWGVYRFKRGFGGELKRSAGVYARVLQPGLYKLYSMAMKIRKSALA